MSQKIHITDSQGHRLAQRWLSSDRVALTTNEIEWTGDELLRRAGGAAEWLRAHGVAATSLIATIAR